MSNILKEAKEELGVTFKQDQLVKGSYKLREANHKYFSQSFVGKLDLPIEAFKIQKEEVEGVRWITIKDLSAWLKERPQDFTASFPAAFEEHKKLIGRQLLGK